LCIVLINLEYILPVFVMARPDQDLTTIGEEKGTLGLLQESRSEGAGDVELEVKDIDGVQTPAPEQKTASDGGPARLEYLDSFRGFIMLVMVSPQTHSCVRSIVFKGNVCRPGITQGS
jgi:hypothetical protein